jgi:phosphotransferase system enzyme I (PtsI)
LLEWAQGRPVTIRTLDAGGDKPITGLTPTAESNPFLGVRGLRLSLVRPDVFKVQLRALARAAVHGPLKVMLPMVSIAQELEQARTLQQQAVAELQQAGIAAAMPVFGMMVEVPAAALTIDMFNADFFSIGSNDLVQYVMAAGRDCAGVAALQNPLHPAVLELIRRVAEHAAGAGVEVSLCGEMAAQPECLPALLSAGLTTLSVPAAALAEIKAALANISQQTLSVPA